MSNVRERVTTSAQKPRKHVQHLVMIKELAIAHELGVDVRSICGVWVKPWSVEGAVLVRVLDTPAGPAFPNLEPRDCGNCSRAYTARARRLWRKKQGR